MGLAIDQHRVCHVLLGDLSIAPPATCGWLPSGIGAGAWPAGKIGARFIRAHTMEAISMKRTGFGAAAGLFLLVAAWPFASFAYDPKNFSEKFQTCMDKANGVTMSMHECIGAEIAVQDKRLNDNYKEYLKYLTPERKTQLVELQKLWIKYRDMKCKFFYDPEGGTLAGILGHSCLLDMTAERADELKHETY